MNSSGRSFQDIYGPYDPDSEVEWYEYVPTPQKLSENRKYDMLVLTQRKGIYETFYIIIHNALTFIFVRNWK